MNSPRRLLLVFCCAAILAGAARTALAANKYAIYTQKKDSAQVTVAGTNSEADQVEVGLSGTVSVTLRVEGSATLEVEKVDPVTASDNWKERRRQAPQVKQGGADHKVWQQEFALDPQRPGQQVLSLVPLRYRQDPNDAWQTATWDPIPIKVTTEITQTDPKELRDIVPPEQVSQPERGYPWLTWAGLGLIAVALILGIWAVKRRFTRIRPAVLPERWAMKELDRIREMKLPADGDGIKHHALVSDVLRRYLELRFQLKAPGKTTTEFLWTTRLGGYLTAQQFSVLSDALDRCDLAKFAQFSPTSEECLELERNAQTLFTPTTRATA